VREYIVAPAQPLPLDEVLPFLEGLQEGIQSRYSVQQRAYPFPVRRTQLLVYELFQAVRLKRGQLKTVLLHTDPLGTPFPKIRDELMRAMEGAKEVVILAGAREGLPVGLMRACDFVAVTSQSASGLKLWSFRSHLTDRGENSCAGLSTCWLPLGSCR